MKSTILAVLPFVGAAFAESVCSRKTVTHTEYAKVYETVKAVDVKPKPSVCSRRTVTATTTEKVYVTVSPEDAKTTSTIDVTSTSTTTRTTTITVYPSKPVAASSTGPSYPTISSQSVQPEYSIQYTPVPQSEVANPTPSSEAPVAPTSKYEAPAEPSAAPEPPKEVDSSAAGSKKGDATFYGGNVGGGMCSFTGYTIPRGLFGTALSDSNWAGGANCGACVQVTGPSGTKITAMVVDQCPGCGPNHVDLFPDAFARLAEPSKGVIPVSWDIVSCGITTPIVLKNKEGTSKFWFSMQVMNSNIPVSKLEVSTDGGKTWKATTRKEYNFFEQSSGFGTDSVDVKVTSTKGGSIVVKGVSIAAGSTKTAGSNFS
ncbi:RlpA-like double-psi beta-barrel-protein domain-containing protein-containing protein [Pyrenochaeta sp. MPI-SDFR-AT-0127]|nr:RlpA-like double-psi beta-barrel-protein domain-containing protein-containing protein [Pyrenochaeta sp. MPI-SDFR-AT-0127]